MDRSVFRLAKANASYPASYVTMGSAASLILAYDVDYSRSNAQHVVMYTSFGYIGEPNLSGYSLDGGSTWTPFPSQPQSGGGVISAPSIDSILMGSGSTLYRSTNRGTSWSLPTGLSGANFGSYSSIRKVIAVDGSNPSTVYCINGSGTVYRSLDAGATWAARGTVTSYGGAQTKLRSVPGQAGHLFCCEGSIGGGSNANPHAGVYLWRSIDGGLTWTQVAGVGEARDCVAGAAAPGQSYPAIYFSGWYNNVYGVWRSTDNCATWASTVMYPCDSVDLVTAMAASPDTYGDVYVAFLGSGWGYGTLASGAGRTFVAFAGGWVGTLTSTRLSVASSSGVVQVVSMGVSTPVEGSAVAFPFTASGGATPGATVTCYNDGTGAVLGTAAANGSGAWTMTINGTA
jgi:hypothetical protein